MTIQKTKSKVRPILLAVGAGVALSLASLSSAQASTDNFKSEPLKSGYNLADNKNINAETNSTAKSNDDQSSGKKDVKEGKCSAGKCSAGNCRGANHP